MARAASATCSASFSVAPDAAISINLTRGLPVRARRKCRWQLLQHRRGSDGESICTMHRALEVGITHIDTAEIYGPYTNEELVGRLARRLRLPYQARSAP